MGANIEAGQLAGTALGALIREALAAQQDLTAVERFSRWHDGQGLGAPEAKYSKLLPASPPGPGQQYAFDVDLDRCTGCKACVTACHSLNGLDDGEAWRTVGLLHGGTQAAPVLRTVTTSCHHCVEPACLSGCPVRAYEKDPITGIVRHLDDQCIGCQYCVFMCPYEAPKLNSARGIVRKCDMCSNRLAHGEAPACVQGCPTEAIRITVVDQAQVVEQAAASAFLPGVPPPGDTLPTTVYRAEHASPGNLLPADFQRVAPAQAHPALSVMLVLTQLSVGAFWVHALVASLLGGGAAWGPPAIVSALFAAALGAAALGASTLHLGRPRYAFRALLGLGTSWLSREILAFSLFAGLIGMHAVALLTARWQAQRELLVFATAVAGAAGIFCSVMVYAATRRAYWRASATGFRFFSTAVLLGGVAVLALSTVMAALDHGPVAPKVLERIALAVVSVALLKLGAELGALAAVRQRGHSPQKRAAVLVLGPLRTLAAWRFIAAALGGVVAPLVLLRLMRDAGGDLSGPGAPVAGLVAVAVAVFGLSVAGELLERHLFFVAAPPSKMPGGLP